MKKTEEGGGEIQRAAGRPQQRQPSAEIRAGIPRFRRLLIIITGGILAHSGTGGKNFFDLRPAKE